MFHLKYFEEAYTSNSSQGFIPRALEILKIFDNVIFVVSPASIR